MGNFRRIGMRNLLNLVLSFTILTNAGLLPLSTKPVATAKNHHPEATLAATSVVLQAPDGVVQAGETFNVSVIIQDLNSPLSALQFDLSYDSQRIDLTGFSPGPFLSSTGRSVICPQPAQLSPGLVRFACASSGMQVGPFKNGLLAQLAFVALSMGTSPLNLFGLQLAGPGVPASSIAADSQSDEVTVVPVSAISTSGDALLSGSPETTMTHTFSLTNQGEYTDTFSLSLFGNNWPSTLSSQTSGPLATGATISQTLVVTIPQVSDGAKDVATVTIQSGWDPEVVETIRLTTVAESSDVTVYLPLLLKNHTSSASIFGPALPAEMPGPALPPGIHMVGRRSLPPQIPALDQTCYSTDFDCDHDVDESDLSLAAERWNCAGGDLCYDIRYDLDNNGVIDVFDLAWVGNDYDTAPPEISILSPAEGAVASSSEVAVTGTISDTHDVVTVTVNGIPAELTAGNFSAAAPVSSGNQTIEIVAEDELGQVGMTSRIVAIDDEGPAIAIHLPKDKQAVYTLTPQIILNYTDLYSSVDPGSLVVLLEDENGGVSDVSGDLMADPHSAQGTVGVALVENMSYTLTVSLADGLGNISLAQASFYVPPAPGSISPPEEPGGAGWVSGVVYDSSTCDEHLSTCAGLPGARVTLSAVDPAGLVAARSARAGQLANTLVKDKTRGLRPMAAAQAAEFSTAISGTIITGPGGFFAFPVGETGLHWVRVEKDGYTYGQREAEIVRERSTATNDIYLTPLDPALTICDSAGCDHSSSDGNIQVEIPAGAIPAGEAVDVTATLFDQVEFLPSGSLPDGTWETYAFNLGGDSEVSFDQPITVRVENDIGFSPGTPVPLGYWNQVTQQWEHAGTGIVDDSGQWVEMQATHFSNYDCNDPITEGGSDPDPGDDPDDDDDDCEEGDEGCFISLKSGTFQENLTMPSVKVLGDEIAPSLLYDSARAYPNEVIDISLTLNPEQGVTLGDYVAFELSIAGQQTDNFVISATLQAGEVGRYRYLWDGRDSQGVQLPPGLYEYAVKLSIPYQAEYCYALDGIFGNPPDCVNGATGIFVDAVEETWSRGTIELDNQIDSAFGAGWTLDGLQRLYQDEAGRIIIFDGRRSDEFYYPQKDLLATNVGNAQTGFPSLALVQSPANSPQPVATSMQAPANEQPDPSPTVINGSAPSPASSELDPRLLDKRPTEQPPPLPSPPISPRLPLYSELTTNSGTLVCGSVITDTVWAVASQPYVVTCDVGVQAGVALTIEAGVTVQFQHASDDLIVTGTLAAEGTQLSPIAFQPMTSTLPGSWGQLALIDGSAGRLDYVTIANGGNSDGMLYMASDGITITNATISGSASSGVVVVNASPAISGSVITSNTASFGGGIYITGGSPLIRNNTISSNTAGDDGGGIYTINGNPRIEDNWLQANTTFGANFSEGGGVYSTHGNPTIKANTFLSNTAVHGGGGIAIGDGMPLIHGNLFQNNATTGGTFRDGGAIGNQSGDPIIQSNTFGYNSASRGGAISNVFGDPIIEANGFYHNTAGQDGGAVEDRGHGRPVISRNLFRDNSADANGGGLYNASAEALITNNIFQSNSAGFQGGGLTNWAASLIQNNTFYGNVAGSGGGGIANLFERATVVNNIISSNTAGAGGGIQHNYNIIGPELASNLVWNNGGGNYDGIVPGLTDISADPLFVDPANGDFHLLSESPAVDAGHSETYTADDFDGEPRPMGLSPDIGADEFRTLRIFKDSLLGEVGPSQPYSYSIGLTNLVTTTINNVAVVDRLPDDVSFLSYQSPALTCSHDGVPSGGRVTCSLDAGSLAPGTTVPLTIHVTAPAALPAPIWLRNIVTATATSNSGGLLAGDTSRVLYSWCAARLNDSDFGNDIQGAVEAAAPPADIVKISGYCRVEQVDIGKNLTIQGGWNQDFSIRDTSVHTTTLDGQGTETIFAVYDVVSPTIEGLVFTGAGFFGAIDVGLNSSPLIQDNVFQGNIREGVGTAGNPTIQNNVFRHNDDSGVRANGGNAVIVNNVFTDSLASTPGAGIYIQGGAPAIENNTFSNLVTNSSGAAVYVSGNAYIANNLLTDNLTGQDGGAIHISNGAPTIVDNILQDNRATNRGGSIDVLRGKPLIEGNLIQNNVAGGDGGAIRVDFQASPTIRGNSILSNTAGVDNTGSGGAVYNTGTITVENNLIRNNVADFNGGGLYNQSSEAAVSGNTFRANTALRSGGGIFNVLGDMIINQNTFIANTADQYGGGVYISTGAPDITQNIFTANTADIRGGGIYNNSGATIVENNILAGNDGGGVYNSYGPGAFRYNTIVGNMGTGLSNGSGNPDIRANIVANNSNYGIANNGGSPTVDYNDVWNNGNQDYSGLTAGPNDFSVDPLFVDAAAGDFHLTPESPAIDAADPNEFPTSDFEGDVRPSIAGPDVGADEFGGFSVFKKSLPTIVQPGEPFSYTIELNNLEALMATGIVLTDTLPLEVSFTSYQGPGFTCSHDDSSWGGTISCSLADSLPTGASRTLSVTVIATDTLSSPIVIRNVITATASVGGVVEVSFGETETWISWCAVRLNDESVGSVQAAIDASTQATDVIRVSGTCFESDISLNKDLTLQGGWNRDFSARDPRVYLTTLDAQSQGSIIAVSGQVSPTLEGLILTGASDSGIRIGGLASPTIVNNLITGNTGSSGGGLYSVGGSPTIANNVFVANTAVDGGGLYAFFGTPEIWNNSFYENSASNRGGGIYASGGGDVRNNVVTLNSAGSGGGMAVGGTPPSMDYNNVWGNSGGDYWNVAPGPNDISADPLFADAPGGDFHLAEGSPNIDAGDSQVTLVFDFEDEPRLMGAGIDIGADEFLVKDPISLTATDYSALAYDAVTDTYTRRYPDGTTVHYGADGRHDFTFEPDGRKTLYTYNPDGTLATMGIIPPGQDTPEWTWTFSYVGQQISSILDPAGRTTLVTVDSQGNLVQFETPDGARQTFAYDGRHLPTAYTDENGAITNHYFDSYGRISAIIDPLRAVYDPISAQSIITREVRFFNPSDTSYTLINDIPVGDPDNPAPPAPTTADLVDKVDYGRGDRSGHTNKWGNWLNVSDGIGRTTTYQRDEANSVTRIDYPDGDCVEYTYDGNGNRLSEIRMGADQCAQAPEARDPSQVKQQTFTYEERYNQVKMETDSRGFTTTYTYDYEMGLGDAGKLVRIERPQVKDEFGSLETPVISYSYNQWGLLASETDARGAVTQYIYTQGTADEASDGANPLFTVGVAPVPGLLTRIIRDAGGEGLNTIYRDFDAAGNPGLSIGPGGQMTTTFAYDAINRVISETNAIGVITLYEYDDRGNLIRQVDDYTTDGVTGRNVVSEFTYNPDDQRLAERKTDGGLTVQIVAEYDINGKKAVERDGRGNQTIFLYDQADQLVNTIDPAGYVMTNTYALDGLLIDSVDADGYITHRDYDGFGRLVSETVDYGGLNIATSYGYDLDDNLVTVTDPAGTLTCYKYDALNRRTATTQDCQGLYLRTETIYDLNGNPVYQVDHRGIVTYFEYDGLNRQTLMRLDDGGLNLENATLYDPAGNQAQVVDERGVVTGFNYDALNRLTSGCQDAQGLNLCTLTTYDTLDNPQIMTDPAGVAVFTIYNGFGSLVQSIEDYGGLNATTNYGYDSALNRIQIVDPNGNSTTYNYTARNEVATETFADGSRVAFTYDGRGNLILRTNQDNSTIGYSYDGASRLLGKSFSTGGSQTLGYDAAGRLISAQQAMSGHTSLLDFEYNSLNDTISTYQSLDGTGWPVVYDYDYASGVVTTTYPSGIQRIQETDSLSRLTAVRQDSGTLIASYTYDDAGSSYTVTYANSLSNRTDYDTLRQKTRISSAVADYRYGYDAAGNRTYLQRWHETDAPADVYEYDGLHQLARVWYKADALDSAAISKFGSLQSYELDNLGNRLKVRNVALEQQYLPNNGQALTNVMNRYEQVDGASFSYDLRGNTLNDGRNSYNYDILNRQILMSGPGGEGEYVYDALDRRIAKIVDGLTTFFVYDQRYRVLEERAGNGSLRERYTFGAGADEPLTLEKGGSIYFYGRDALGSVTELTDMAGGLVESYKYDVYGRSEIFDAAGVSLTISAVDNPYQFTGRRFDLESGNLYYRARIYSPQTGRFLQMDPAGPIDDLNLYLYVSNRPTVLTDPSGLFGLRVGLSGSFTIAKGPLPPPVVWIWWSLEATFHSELFECCNENGNKETWGTVGIGMTFKLYAGGTIAGDGIPVDLSATPSDLRPCPARGCSGSVSAFIQAKAAFGYYGVIAAAKLPIYPQFTAPVFSMTFIADNSLALELSVGISGGGECTGPVNSIFNVF